MGIPAEGLNARLQECSNKPPQPGEAQGHGGRTVETVLSGQWFVASG